MRKAILLGAAAGIFVGLALFKYLEPLVGTPAILAGLVIFGAGGFALYRSASRREQRRTAEQIRRQRRAAGYDEDEER